MYMETKNNHELAICMCGSDNPFEVQTTMLVTIFSFMRTIQRDLTHFHYNRVD